jgi:hypothetical protein
MLADSLAAFAEESVSFSGGTAVRNQPLDPPWGLTFGVLAADLLAIAYIHRAKIKSRLLAWRERDDPGVAPQQAM